MITDPRKSDFDYVGLLKAIIFAKAEDISVPPISFKIGPKQFFISTYSLLQGFLIAICFYLSLFFLLFNAEQATKEKIENQMAQISIALNQDDKALDGQATAVTQISDSEPLIVAELKEAPIAGLYDREEFGDVPKIDLIHKKTPYSAYQRPFSNIAQKPLISLVMKDYGVSKRLSERAREILPGEVTFVLSPYPRNIEDFQKSAREDGHEVWLQLPLENNSYPPSDPGPQAILSRLSLRYNTDQLLWLLTRTVGYSGIVMMSDDVFNNAEPMFRSLMREIYDRGLGIFELNTNMPSEIPEKVSRQLQTPYRGVDINLDSEKWRGNRTQAFEFLETIASGKGAATAIFEPHPETLIAIDLWARNLEQQGFQLAPLSAVIGDFELTPAMLQSVRIKQEQAEEEKREFVPRETDNDEKDTKSPIKAER